MSVAASKSRPSSACRRIPPSTWTAPRVETARETMPSEAASSAFEHVIRSAVPEAVSVFITEEKDS